ncbi:hypothetical protein EG329_002527 [Mollisiaceae sp. DMI_Dod_QoI]|nr:hypothetical protein EG329_002527 [Helotiales sp. DMI_Dod_QoI]
MLFGAGMSLCSAGWLASDRENDALNSEFDACESSTSPILSLSPTKKKNAIVLIVKTPTRIIDLNAFLLFIGKINLSLATHTSILSPLISPPEERKKPPYSLRRRE